MFALRIHYLTGRSDAASYRDRKMAEWPPHPARLFAALAAACFERGADREEQAVLYWLESLDPPLLTVPKTVDRTSPIHYVPVNDLSAAPDARIRQPRHFPSAVPDEAPVTLQWPTALVPGTLQDALTRLLSEVTCLGRSGSFVEVVQTTSVPAPTHLPDPKTGVALRVPYQGMLDYMQKLHAADQKAPVGRLCFYYEAQQKTRQHANFTGLCIYQLSGSPVSGAQSLQFAEAVRATLLSQLQGRNVPAALHGHDGDHMAVLPLAWVEGEFADGLIKGVAIAVPRGLGPRDTADLLDALQRARLNETDIWTSSVLGRVQLSLVEGPTLWTLAPESWTAPSCNWATTTPVIFGHFPHRGLEDAIQTMCSKIGLPRTVSIEVRSESYWPGVPPSWQFSRHRARDEANSKHLCFHVRIQFSRPVTGPLLMGKYRHFGMGLFRPVRSA